MNLDNIKEKLAKRVFNHLKNDEVTKQVFENNRQLAFVDYVGGRVFGQTVLPHTDTYKNGLTVGQMNDEHHLEMLVIGLLNTDIDFRDGFGKLVADKLIAHYEQ